MEIQIVINPEIMALPEFKKKLESLPVRTESDLVLEEKTPGLPIRGIDPTILIAVVGAAGTGFGALITGLLQLAQQTSTKKIIIQSRDGMRLEFPADMSPKEIDNLIDKAKRLDIQKILLP